MVTLSPSELSEQLVMSIITIVLEVLNIGLLTGSKFILYIACGVFFLHCGFPFSLFIDDLTNIVWKLRCSEHRILEIFWQTTITAVDNLC